MTKATFWIRDLETLRVVADPLRAQLIELLIQEPMTIRQAAEKLGLAPSKLYYHFGLLEKHGLIEVAETRTVANLIEKVYRATASEIDVEKDLLNFATREGKEGINALVASTIDATREDLLRSLQARDLAIEQGAPEQPRRVIVTRAISRIPESRANEFTERLSALMHEFEAADRALAGESGELQPYAFTIAFYPSFYFHEPSQG